MRNILKWQGEAFFVPKVLRFLIDGDAAVMIS